MSLDVKYWPILIIAMVLTLVGLGWLSIRYDPNATYEVYCMPKGDWCVIIEENHPTSLRREELPNHMPIATTTERCSLEFCVNEDMDIIGLNPDYHLWRE